jgi:methyl-accepting chemotaxis protein
MTILRHSERILTALWCLMVVCLAFGFIAGAVATSVPLVLTQGSLVAAGIFAVALLLVFKLRYARRATFAFTNIEAVAAQVQAEDFIPPPPTASKDENVTSYKSGFPALDSLCYALEHRKKLNSQYVQQIMALADEIYELTESYCNFRDTVADAIDELRTRTEEFQREQEMERKTYEAYIAGNLGRIQSVMHRFAEGDLTVRIPVDKGDEVGELATAINMSIELVREIMRRVKELSLYAANAATHIQHSSTRIASSAGDQVQQVTLIAGSMESINRAIAQNTDNAIETLENATQSREIAAEGEKVLSEALMKIEGIADVIQSSANSIQTLGNYTFNIAAAVDMISKIAKRINLISINASIEATRAGLEGRAFGVIAAEIRDLADQTKNVTDIIRSTLSAIQTDVQQEIETVAKSNVAIQDGVSAVHKASESLQRIIENSNTVFGMLESVVSSTQEQAGSMNDVVSNMNASLMLVEETSNTLSESVVASTDLNQLVDSLYQTLEMFKTNEDEPESLADTALEVSESSEPVYPLLTASANALAETSALKPEEAAKPDSKPDSKPEITIDLGDW